MKLLVFSDSHGDVESMWQVTELEQPDGILHLGDLVQDAQRLSEYYPEVPLYNVCGNCDGWCDTADEHLLTIGGRKLLLTHGHRYRVKMGQELAVAAAREAQADVLLYGHTHIPLCDRQGELWIVNPGSIRGPVRRTYALIELDGETVHCHIEAWNK